MKNLILAAFAALSLILDVYSCSPQPKASSSVPSRHP
jgi:hypothetical protein